MKILFLDSAHPSLIEGLRKKGHDCVEDYEGAWDVGRGTKDEGRGTGYEGIVIRSRVKMDKTMIDQFPDLKFIARVGAGMENIDVPYAEKKGIHCLHAPAGNSSAVAEHAIGMLLMLANNLRKADREVREGKWIREENRGWELEGKTVVVIGYGFMGSAMVNKLSGFDCNVLVHDKYIDWDAREKESKGAGFTPCTLETVFEQADIVSLHLPLTEETLYYADEKFFASFKKPIVFLNTARGKNLKTSALVEAMRSGKVTGACLDVLEFESTSFEKISGTGHPELEYLQKSDKTVLTPHIGGWTHESNVKMAEILLDKIQTVAEI